jgi:type II secretory pathway pseudopilin PulG
MHPRSDERGFSLIEALTAATISVIAVLGLAHSFGLGRALVDRYEVARAALSEAQSQLEALTLTPTSDATLAVGYVSPLTPFQYEGATLGSQYWRVVGYDEPHLPGTNDLRRVIMTVRWRQGDRTDSLSLERLWLP